MNRAQSTERLRNASKPIYRVKERRISILSNTLKVQAHFVDCFHCRSVQVRIISVQCQCVSKEILSLFTYFEFFIYIFHRLIFQIKVSPCHRIFLLHLVKVNVEVAQIFHIKEAN